MPTPILHDNSPFEVLFGDVPAISHLRIFGCAYYPLLKPYLNNKLQPKTIKCVFLGHESQYKGYICYDVSRKRTYISRHIVFDEHDYPYTNLLMHSKPPHRSHVMPSTSSSLPIVTNTNIVVLPASHDTTTSNTSTTLSNSPYPCSSSPHISPLPSSPSPFVQNSPMSITGTSESSSSIQMVLESNNEATSIVSPFQPKTLQVVLKIPPMNLHPMQTRSKIGIVKKKGFLTTLQESGGVDLSLVEPATYKTALTVFVWLTAMKEKVDAFTLRVHGVWCPCLQIRIWLGVSGYLRSKSVQMGPSLDTNLD
ncbi:hypothetical protein TB1_012881 [Malus domestica]